MHIGESELVVLCSIESVVSNYIYSATDSIRFLANLYARFEEKKRTYYGKAPSVRKQYLSYLHAFIEMCMRLDNVSHIRMIVPPFLVSVLCPFCYLKKVVYIVCIITH